MLLQNVEFQFSEYNSLYKLIVPQKNLLRKINNSINFSFVHDELVNKYFHTNGCTAESPFRMVKYLLLKCNYDISDVDVVERSRFNMSFKYFLDLSPEEEVINPSSLTKFRKQRLKDADLLNLQINKTVSIPAALELLSPYNKKLPVLRWIFIRCFERWIFIHNKMLIGFHKSVRIINRVISFLNITVHQLLILREIISLICNCFLVIIVYNLQSMSS